MELSISFTCYDLHEQSEHDLNSMYLLTFLMYIIAGDEVSFIVKHTPKGVQADGLQLMIAEVTT